MFTFHTIVFLWSLLSISFSCNNSYFHFIVITLTFHSIVSLVAVIYCIVIIYLPSLIEAETNFVVSFCITIKGLVLEKRKVTFETIGCCRGQSDAQQQRLTGTSPTPFRQKSQFNPIPIQYQSNTIACLIHTYEIQMVGERMNLKVVSYLF